MMVVAVVTEPMASMAKMAALSKRLASSVGVGVPVSVKMAERVAPALAVAVVVAVAVLLSLAGRPEVAVAAVPVAAPGWAAAAGATVAEVLRFSPRTLTG